MSLAEDFADFMTKSTTPYNFCADTRSLLLSNSYVELSEHDFPAEFPPKFFVIRDGKTLLAFNVGEMNSALIVGAHDDSPALKLKPNHVQTSPGAPTVLRHASYAGGLAHSYHGRDLRVAGAVLVRDRANPTHVAIRVVDDRRAICIIPFPSCGADSAGLSPTFDRENGMNPIFTFAQDKTLLGYVAGLLGVAESDIVGQELSLVDSRPCTIFGDFALSPRFDNLASSYGALKGFVGSDPHRSVSVCAVFGNEEIGSRTRTGACGDLLESCLRRLCAQKGVDYDVLKAKSLFVSADAAHAQHPNHPGLGEQNHPLLLGSGVALKETYKGSWAYDGAALAILIEAAKSAGVEYSLLCTKNGRRGGGTIGPKVECW
jgi:aspartyl aminopeptidase